MINEKGRIRGKLLFVLMMFMAAGAFFYTALLMAEQLPTVRIASPADGADVSGIADIQVEYSIRSGHVHALILYAGGAEVEREYVGDRAGTRVFHLDTADYPSGELAILVRAYSAAPPSDHYTTDEISLNIVSSACGDDDDCSDGDDHSYDTCSNPGSPDAICSHQVIECLDDSECDDSNPLTIDDCSNPGAPAANCVYTEFACNADADCDDSNVSTEDRCHSGGAAGAWCTNKEIACFTNEDCDDLNNYTEDKCHSGGTAGAWCTNNAIACLTNSDCDEGDDHTEDICKNPGQSSSSCKHNDIECLNNSECDDGDPATADTCENPGNAQSDCEHAAIACLDNQDCDDGNPMTLDTCANPGTAQASCVHDPLECGGNSDCADSNPLTIDACENPGEADSACVHSAIACNSDADCDDSNGYTLDSCVAGGTIGASCSRAAVACLNDSDCDDENQLTADSCKEPGTGTAACSNTMCDMVCESDGECDDGNPLTTDVCLNIETCEASCSHLTCKVACWSDDDCSDENPLTFDACSGSGTCGASCSHTACEVTCSADSDCDDSIPATTDTCANPGSCEAACSNVACEVACGSDAGCDDGNAATNDTCENAGTCQAECEHAAIEPEPEPEPVQLTLTVTNPDDGLITNDPSLTVSGMTTPGAAVTAGGRPAEVTTDGAFSISVLLNEGNNIIEIDAALNEDRLSETISAMLDTKGPSVISSEPEDGAEISVAPSRIAVRIEDAPGGTGLNVSAIRVFLDGEELAGHYVTTSQSYEGSIDTPASGNHILSISASDLAGNIIDRTLSFSLTGKGPQIKILKLPGEHSENSFTASTSAPSILLPADPTETTPESGTTSIAATETSAQPSPSAGSDKLPQSSPGWLTTGHNYRLDAISELLKDKYPNSGWTIGDWSASGGGKSSPETNAAISNLLESSPSPTTTAPSLIHFQDISGSGDIEAQVVESGSPVDADTIVVEVDGVVVTHEYDAATKKVKSKVKGLKKGSHSAKVTASDTDGATGMALSAFTVGAVADILTFENLTTPGTEVHAGDRFKLHVDSTYQYTPWAVLYNPVIPVAPGTVGSCNAQYFVGDGYNLALIDGTTYNYETEGVFYTSADHAGREAGSVYAATPVGPMDESGNGECLFSSESLTVINGPVKPGLDSATFNKANDPAAKVISLGDEYTVAASGSPGVVNVDFWLIDTDQIVGDDIFGAAVDSGVITETSLGSGQYALTLPRTLSNITPPDKSLARFLLALVKPRAWNSGIPPAVSDMLYIGPSSAPVFNVVEVINADHPGEPLRPGQRYKIHIQGEIDYSHMDHLKVVLINSDRFYPQWKPYYGTGLFIPGTESSYNNGLNWMDPNIYGPGIYEAEGFMPALADADGQAVSNVRAIITAASYFDYSASSPVPAEQSQQQASIENIRMGNVDHPDWTTVAASETVRVEAMSDPGMNFVCHVDAASFSGGETTVPVIGKAMAETQSGRYSCEDIVLTRPDINGTPANILMAKIYSGDGATFLDISDDFLTFRDKITEVHFRNLSREGAEDIAPGERFEITAVGQPNLTEEIYGSVLDAFINHSSAQQPVFQPTDRLFETQSGSGIYRIESTLADVPDGITRVRAAIGDPDSPIKPVFSTEILSLVPAEPPKPPEITHINDIVVTNGEVTSDSLSPVVAGTAEPESVVKIYEFLEGEGTPVHSVPGGLPLSAAYVESSGTYSDDFNNNDYTDNWSLDHQQGTWEVAETGDALEMTLQDSSDIQLASKISYRYDDGFSIGFNMHFPSAENPSLQDASGRLQITADIDVDGQHQSTSMNWFFSPGSANITLHSSGNLVCDIPFNPPATDTVYFMNMQYSASQSTMRISINETETTCPAESYPSGAVKVFFLGELYTAPDPIRIEWDNFTTGIPIPSGYEVSGPALSLGDNDYDGFGTGGGLLLSPCVSEGPVTMPVVNECVTGEKDIHAFLVTIFNLKGENDTVVPELKATIYSTGNPSTSGEDQLSLAKEFFDAISGQYIGGYSIDGEVVALRAPTAGAPNDYDPVVNLVVQEQICQTVPGTPGYLRWDSTHDNGDGTMGAYMASYTPLAYNGKPYDYLVGFGANRTGDAPVEITPANAPVPIWWADGLQAIDVAVLSFTPEPGMEEIFYTVYGTQELLSEKVQPEFIDAYASGIFDVPVNPGIDDYRWNPAALPDGVGVAPLESCSNGMFKLIGETTANASGTFATQVVSFQAAGDHVITAKSTKNDFTTKWSDPVIYHLQTGEPTDTTPPSISFVSYSDGDCLNNTQPAVTISILDGGSDVDWPGVNCSTSVGVSCSISRSGETAEAEITFGSALPESVVLITVEADDLADPKNHTEKSISLHIDITPPLPFSTPPQAWSEPGIAGEYDDDPEIFLTYTETADNPGGCGIAAYYALVVSNPADCINATGEIATPGQHTATGFEGLNYYCIAAADRAGNRVASSDAITIDLTLPVISTPSAAPNPFSPNGDNKNETTTITASVTDANLDAWKVEIEETGLQIAAGTGSVVTASWNGSGLSDGPHSYRVSAIDLAGNYSEATASVKIDKTPPIVSITNPANTERINPASYTLQAEASDVSGIASVEFFLNGSKIDFATESAPGVFSLTYDFAPLKKQWVTFDAKATDNAGNTNSNTILFFVQNKPLTVQSLQIKNITRPGATDISAGEIFLVTAVLSGKDDSFEVRVGNASRLSPWPPQSAAYPFIQFSLIQGKWKGTTYTLKGVLLSTNDGNGLAATSISAVASLDNYTTISVSPSFAVVPDTTPPSPPEISKPRDGTKSADTTPDIAGTAEPLSNITVYLKGSPDTPVAFAVTTAAGKFTTTSESLSPAGPKQLYAVAADSAGNTSAPSAIVNYTLKDTTNPVIKDVSDAPDPFSPCPDPNNAATCASRDSKDTTTIKADVFDETPRRWLVRIYNPANTLVLQYPEDFDLPTDPIGPNPLSFIWDGNKPRKNKTPLPQPGGTYRYELQAVDFAGRKSEWSTGTVTIDKTAPTAHITLPANGAEIFDSSIPVVISATDNIAVDYVVISVDGNEIGKATAPVALNQYEYSLSSSLLDLGNHTVSAVAWDTAGNWSATSSITIHIDSAPPILSNATASEKIISPAVSAGVKDHVAFFGVATDKNLAGWSVEILNTSGTAEFVHEEPFISPQPYVPATFTYTWNGKNTAGTTFLSDGEYTWFIKAFDAIGNSAAATGTLTVDNTPPGVAITSPNTDDTIGGVAREVIIETVDNNEIVSVALFVDGVPDSPAVQTATSTWQAAIYPHVYSDGPHTLGAVATDIAENQSATATVNITIETVAPNPPINLISTENPDGTVTLTWEPPTTNVNGSPLTDLAGYNIYKITEENRCEPVNSVSGDTTPVICDSGSTPGTFTINGPTLSFGGTDFNITPLGSVAVWIDLNNQNNPVTPLPLTDSADIDPSKPVFAFLLQLNLTARSGQTPGEYRITAYTQHSWSEIEQWLTMAIQFGIFTSDSRIIIHTIACANSGPGGFVSLPLPFSSIPNFNPEKMNIDPISDSVFSSNDLDITGDLHFVLEAVDVSSNKSNISNIETIIEQNEH